MIRLEGIDEVLESIEDIGNTEQFSGILEKACALVEGEAKKAAPKDTGALRRSITSKVENTGSEIQGVVFTPLEYAPYRYVRSLNRAKSGEPKQLKLHWQSRGN